MFQTLRPLRLPIIKHPSAVRTVHRTISSADAPVIHLNVQSFVVVVGCVHGTDRFAWRVFTMLAQDRYEPGLYVRELPLPIALNSNPLICSALLIERFNIDRNIVLGLTRDNTSLAPSTFIQVDYHSPFVSYSLSYHRLTYLRFSAVSPGTFRRSPVQWS